MKLSELGGTAVLTVILSVAVAVAAAGNYTARLRIPATWEAHRCDPGVIPIAAAFKPAEDTRTPAEFARDNWSFCQKQYVERGIRAAAEAPKEVLRAQEGVVSLAEELVDDLGDTFVNLWKFCYSAYAGFMDQMKGAAKLFQNFMMEPENAALASEFAGYDNGITGSHKFLPEEFANAPEINPPASATTEFVPPCPPAVVETYNKIWTNLLK